MKISSLMVLHKEESLGSSDEKLVEVDKIIKLSVNKTEESTSLKG